MTRIQRSLVAALAVLGTGAAFGAWAWRHRGQNPGGGEKPAPRLFAIGRVEVESGSINAMAFERAGGGWRIVAPVSWPADKEAIDTAIDHMAGVRADAVITESASASELADYGLERPSITMTVKLEDGSSRTLHVGAKHTMDEAYFITDGAKERIALAAAAFHWALSRDLHAFRDKRVFGVAIDTISDVSVEKGGALTYRLSKKDGGWRVDPPDAPADPSVVERFLRVLTRDLRAESFAADGVGAEGLPAYGLDRPSFAITVDGTRAVLGASGAGAPPGGPFLLTGGAVIAVYEDFARDLDKDAGFFLDRTIARCDADAVAKVEIHGRAVYEREGAGWRVSEPAGGKVESWRVADLLVKLCSLRAARLDAAAKLTKPEWRVTFRAADASQLADMSFGGPADEAHVYVAGNGRTGAVDKQMVELLEKLVR